MMETDEHFMTDGKLVWVQKTLYPNQRSSLYLGDSDYIGHGSLVWKFGSTLVQPRGWSPYMFNTTYVCREHTANERASFRCVFSHYNWGPRTWIATESEGGVDIHAAFV